MTIDVDRWQQELKDRPAVWVTVSVPPSAKAGNYKGKLAITAEGASPVVVPVELHVANWQLPDPKEFSSHVGLTQSPESVALRYKVAMWSPKPRGGVRFSGYPPKSYKN